MSILPGSLVGELIHVNVTTSGNGIQKMVPNPRLVPLLKGSVGRISSLSAKKPRYPL